MSPDQVARLARKAWIALALAPVGFLVAIAVGEGIYGLLGYEAADAAPLSARLTAALPALVLQAAPAFLAARWGHRAFSAGNRNARVPGITGVVLLIFMGVITAAGLSGWA